MQTAVRQILESIRHTSGKPPQSACCCLCSPWAALMHSMRGVGKKEQQVSVDRLLHMHFPMAPSSATYHAWDLQIDVLTLLLCIRWGGLSLICMLRQCIALSKRMDVHS